MVPSLVAPELVALRVTFAGDWVVLGWIGSASTSQDLAELPPALERLATAASEVTCAPGRPSASAAPQRV